MHSRLHEAFGSLLPMERFIFTCVSSRFHAFEGANCFLSRRTAAGPARAAAQQAAGLPDARDGHQEGGAGGRAGRGDLRSRQAAAHQVADAAQHPGGPPVAVRPRGAEALSWAAGGYGAALPGGHAQEAARCGSRAPFFVSIHELQRERLHQVKIRDVSNRTYNDV